MDDIIRELKELEDLTIRCMKCGTCQAHCPLYQKDLEEHTVARGKIALIEAVFEGRIEKASSILKHLDYCLLCGRCKVNCPSGVSTDAIFLKAKEVLRKIEKLPNWGKIVLKLMMEKPELIAKLSPLMHIGQKFGSKKIKKDILRPIFAPFKERTTYQIATKTFCSQYGGLHQANNEKMRILFYPGCAINMIFTSWGKTIVEILNHYGVSVYINEKNYCCGIPAATLGDMDLYKKMIINNYNTFDTFDVDYIITACPTCQYALKEIGPKLIKKETNKQFIDIILFLVEILKVELEPITEEKITLHLPCHYDQTKEQKLNNVLKQIGTNFAQLDNKSCCGFGGTFNLKNYKNSKEIGKNKATEVIEKGFKKVLSPCPGCVMQLTDTIYGEDALDVEITHPVMLMYESIFNKTIK
ncbi:MAG: (Fe-S)-binding protein [Calditerrivibrio sp.]|nr:(Fe-S)-binding protein [Calditerrivibrio sp.]